MNPPQDNRRPDESLDIADQIDQICDAFEESWSREETPRIEDFLERGMALPRDRLLVELLLIDREYRINRGDLADRGIYLRRFPDYSTVIEGLDFATIVERNGRARAQLSILPSLEPGTTIGGFELVKQLGLGAAGTVWLARDARLRRLIALKTPREEFLCHNVRDRFLREGQSSAQLRHPNIVAVHDVGEDRGRAFIIAEFIDGVSLRERLDKRRLTPREAAELTAVLAEALHHAHEQGVVHRDLKPANIILDRDEQPHITDFGLAKWAEDSRGMTLHGQLLGTPAYMSPEQARGDAARVDRRADVFALGVILYETLTGRPPFEGEPAAVIDAIIRQEAHRPRSVDRSIARDLETICLKAMEKEVERRYVTTQEMAVDLRRFLRGEAILARRPSLREQSWKYIKRRPALASAIVLGAVAVGSLAMAGALAERNRTLLGIHTVALTTNPPGARLTFVPLREVSMEPLSDEIIRPQGLTPVTATLKAGDYLVVAVHPDGRFHEVLRHVPSNSQAMPGPYDHTRWFRTAEGTVELPLITLPASVDLSETELIDGARRLQSAADVQPGGADESTAIYMDRREFNYGNYRDAIRGGQWPPRMNSNPPPEHDSMPLMFDQAISYAEELGKRLPSAEEYRAATRVQERPHPSAVHTLRIQDLETGLPEWTTTGVSPPKPYSQLPLDDALLSFSQFRVVQMGDNIQGFGGTDPNITADFSREVVIVPKAGNLIAVGFRCVRSATPRFQPRP